MNIVDTVRKHVVDKYSEAYDSDDLNMYKVHVRYVVDYAKELARKLGADIEIVEIAALLHDIARIDGTNENHHI
jgi:HD superfamily phosphodiesterase